MKKVMILGAASGQIPFIDICKKRGAFVIVVSPKGDYPGFKYADQILYADTRDKEKILELAKKEKIDGILTDQTDVSVPTVAYVAEKMNLRGIGYEMSMKFTDKFIMRSEAKKVGINVPKFAKASCMEEVLNAISEMEYPVIIKPTNSSGSRGVNKVENEETLTRLAEDSFSYSPTHTVIVEEFIVGREYLVDGLAIDNKYINLDLGIKEYFDIENKYISKMCMFSSADMIETDCEKAVLEANKQLVEGFRLPFGITHAEYILSEKNKKVYLVEIAARGGGVFLSSELTPKASGINTNEILIDYVLFNKKVDVTSLKLDRKVAAWRCFELVPGIVSKIENVENVQKINGVFKVCLDNVKLGTKIEELVDDTGKKGPILVYGKNREACYSAIDEVKKELKIYTCNNEKKYEIRW